jgi:hypothetical protein
VKKLIRTVLIIICFLSSKQILGQDKGLGLGIMLGEPTGFSAKYWLNEDKAFDLGFAYSFIRSGSALSLHADYIQHLFNVIHANIELPVYYGFGARIRASSDTKGMLGARGVAGILFLERNIPLDVFLELAPVFNLFPETALYIDLAIGARYYF